MIETYEMNGMWFGSVEEVVDYIEGQGYIVSDANRSYVAFYNEDADWYVDLAGTDRTVIIKNVVKI